MEEGVDRPIVGVTVNGTELHAPVVDENEVRAAAGSTMMIGAVAFSYAYFTGQYIPLQVIASLFFVEFLMRMVVGLRYSPVGALARLLTFKRPPEWVSATPKRFAWTLGLGMTFAMAIITNIGIRGLLPRTICLVCLTLMWMESALGVCLGCKFYGLMTRRGWAPTHPAVEICTDGACAPPARTASIRGRPILEDERAARSASSTTGLSAASGHASPT
jgi:hypothetical protein